MIRKIIEALLRKYEDEPFGFFWATFALIILFSALFGAFFSQTKSLILEVMSATPSITLILDDKNAYVSLQSSHIDPQNIHIIHLPPEKTNE